MSDDTSYTCPICEGESKARADNEHFPFCSKRCKQEDLGKWFGGNYSMAGRPANPHEIAQKVRDDSDG